MSMTAKQAKLSRLAMRMIALGVVEPERFSFPEVIEFPGDLRRRLISMFVEDELDELLADTDEALRHAQSKLISAHDAAAAITVEAPSDQEVDDFRDALEALHQDIQADQRFRAAINLIVSLQKSIPALNAA